MTVSVNANDYQTMALRTYPTIDNHSQTENLTLSALGLTGESGEFADVIKKWVYHHHPFTEDTARKLKLELGDVLWYVAVAAHVLDMTLSDVMLANIDKLRARYPEGFSTERSMHRTSGDE